MDEWINEKGSSEKRVEKKYYSKCNLIVIKYYQRLKRLINCHSNRCHVCVKQFNSVRFRNNIQLLMELIHFRF